MIFKRKNLPQLSVMPCKRPLEEVSHTKIASHIDTKTFKAGSYGTPKAVSLYGTEEQRRAAATAMVSPDALRFPPSQVRKPLPIKK